MFGTVWIVATPLGNLGDFSPRARETLTRADLILAEDTRRAGQLLNLVGLGGKRLLSLHEHNETNRIDEIMRLVSSGVNVAVVSDAGTPLIADPGYRLVAACRQAGVSVVPIPGPCAPVTALMGSGLPPYPFVFLGFLPRKEGEILALFRPYAALNATLVYFERKNRILRSLDLAHALLGEREFCLARELTKKHEQFINGRLGQPLECDGELLGEVTVVIGPPEHAVVSTRDDVTALVRQLAEGGLRPREVVRIVQERTSGWSSKQIYEIVLEGSPE